jgi:hypothetical protein
VAVKVAREAVPTILDYPDGFVLQVRQPSDLVAGATALRALRLELAAMTGASAEHPEGPVLSEVVVLPDGPLIRFARLGMTDELLQTIPDRLLRHLEAAGLDRATITAPEPGGKLDALDATANAVILRLFPAPAGEMGGLPPEWLDLACEWVLGDTPPGELVPLRVLGVELEIVASDAPAIVHQCGTARAWCDLVTGRFDERIRTASITFGRAPHVALAAGGPAVDSHGLLARFELLAEVARDLAPQVAYACIDLEPTFEGLGLGLNPSAWREQGGAAPNLVAGELVDSYVPDAYALQILGPGHLERVATARREAAEAAEGAAVGGDAGAAGAAGAGDPDDPPLGEPLGEGKVEVLVGDPSDWLPFYDARDDVHAEGLELLRPLLITEVEADAMLATRPARAPRPPVDAGPESVLLSGTPDLDSITLETLPHARRGLRLTLLELVSWLAHEPHTDDPTSVSSVLRTYGRWLASGLDDEIRQTLKARAARFADTASTSVPLGGDAAVVRGDGLDAADAARAWAAADWLVRVQAPAWLELAGLTEAAGRLLELSAVTDNLELVRAVEILGSAIVIAGRRVDITAQIAGDDSDDDTSIVEQVSWVAWERASELTGWVAASEAASVGVPSELSFATDLRVIECSRDANVRDELERSRKTVGDTAWATALHAVANAAWTHGWNAADAATASNTTITLRTAVSRATSAALDRLGIDDDQREAVVESAEVAARDSLTRAALRGGSWEGGEHPWDAARRAARAASGGHAWGTIMDVARDALDESAWDDAMQAARVAIDDALRDAPDMVARTVVAAVAREASSAAARGVALRAAAVARAHSASEADAATAADDALAETVAALRQSAIELLDAMLTPLPAPPT